MVGSGRGFRVAQGLHQFFNFRSERFQDVFILEFNCELFFGRTAFSEVHGVPANGCLTVGHRGELHASCQVMVARNFMHLFSPQNDPELV